MPHWHTSILCSLAERDMRDPHFNNLYLSHRRTNVLFGLVGRDMCVPFSHTQSHLHISPYYFSVGRVTFITMRSNGTFLVEMTKHIDFSLDLSLSVSLPGELDQLRLFTRIT